MQELQIFNNPDFGEIRTLTIDDEPWFVGKDVATALGYSDTKSAVADHIDTEDKTLIQRGQIATLEIPNRGLTIINESGLYSLILSSKLESAKRFKRWVTAEVLPAIRKTGTYSVQLPKDYPSALRALADAEEKKMALLNENARQKQIIGELKPKADYLDDILKNNGLVTITQIAKDYGMSGKAFNKLLHELCVQYYQSGQWLLYSKYHNCGYTHSETIQITHTDGRKDVRMQTKWTQKGRLFLYELLKKNGYLPVIEQNEEKPA